MPATSEKAGYFARSLSYSSDNTEKHYRALERGKSILAYKSVGSILGATVTEKSVVLATPPKCRFYSLSETLLVMEGFKHHISERILPSKKEAEAFLAVHTPKGLFKPHDLYDKTCNIIGRKNLKK